VLRKIRDAGIPTQCRVTNELPARVDAVLTVIHLIFNEGYAGDKRRGTEPPCRSRPVWAPRVDGTATASRSDCAGCAHVAARPTARCLILIRLADLVLLEDQDRRRR